MLEHRGATAQAALLRSCAQDLAVAVEQAQLQALTINKAAQESGYSPSQLRRLVREGRIPNAETEGGQTRIRRGDLPRKAGQSARPLKTEEPDLVGEVLQHRGISPGSF